MEQENLTMVTNFILQGFSEVPTTQALMFLLVLLVYVVVLGGNMAILLLVWLDAHLHTPMYFFLGNLAFIDVSSTTVSLPTFLVAYISRDYIISFSACLTQIYLFPSLTSSELYILTAMSYDRYVAICNPLRYHMVMGHGICILLAIVSWLLCFIETLPVLCEISSFTCYSSNVIDHFFCDPTSLIKLSCSVSLFFKLYILLLANIIGFFIPFLLTFISYIFIISTILKIQSSSGRRKAFYTCSSHLTVVLLLYSSIAVQFSNLTSIKSMESIKLISLFHTTGVPFLNPLIYSLKNKDIKSALKRRFN